MAALNRRAFVAATAASVAAPTVIGAREVPNAGMDWQTMSLEARNLAYNNSAFWVNVPTRSTNSGKTAI
jgi:hypothetical protein